MKAVGMNTAPSTKEMAISAPPTSSMLLYAASRGFMPAAMLRPVRPRMTTCPPVMYSQAWSPTPSTTATAPELRTQNRSPTTPRTNISPPVAP